MSHDERVVAVGILSERDLAMLGDNFHRQYPLTAAGEFGALLADINLADHAYRAGAIKRKDASDSASPAAG